VCSIFIVIIICTQMGEYRKPVGTTNSSREKNQSNQKKPFRLRYLSALYGRNDEFVL
jgi:hypothetical protein